MEKTVYSFEDFRNPEKNFSAGSLNQLEEVTGMDKKSLGKKLRINNIYVEPTGRYKVMKLEHKPSKRINNGDLGNFTKNKK